MVHKAFYITHVLLFVSLKTLGTLSNLDWLIQKSSDKTFRKCFKSKDRILLFSIIRGLHKCLPNLKHLNQMRWNIIVHTVSFTLIYTNNKYRKPR